jgi:ectoine hydroxylase-related dioxygenase (phytanoyl-CoA dioxygenase family)
MDPSCLQYRLTDEERQTFDEYGLLQIENALEPAHVERLTAAVDRLHERHLAQGNPADQAMFYPNFIPTDGVFADLVDYAPILPKVWGILGWNISLYHTHLIVTPPSGRERTDKTFGWHQDSGRVNRDIDSHPRPRLSIKVAYFLSDTSVEGRGNFWVVPKSHLMDDLDLPEGGNGQPAGAVPVLAKPGTAVFFDRRLWHAASPNWSDVTRKVLFYGYGYRWIRPKDDMTVEHLWASSDPIRRQLLGAAVNSNGRYSPSEADVPLRAWLQEHCPEDAA